MSRVQMTPQRTSPLGVGAAATSEQAPLPPAAWLGLLRPAIPPALPLLPRLMEPLLHLLRIPLVVQLQEAGEHLAAGGLADGEADALLGLVEAVAEIEVGPAVGGSDRAGDFRVKFSKTTQVTVSHFFGIQRHVESVQALIVGARPFGPGVS